MPDDLKVTGKDYAALFFKYLREEIRKKIVYVNKAIITEPLAESVAYGLEQTGNKKILVYDLGGGTFDVTIFDFQKRYDRQFDIRVIITDDEDKLFGIDKMKTPFPDYRLDTFKMRQTTLYGTPFALTVINLIRSPQKELSIPIVQGNRIQNVKIGSLIVSLAILNKLID